MEDSKKLIVKASIRNENNEFLDMFFSEFPDV